jgi:type II secretory pathway component PulJ
MNAVMDALPAFGTLLPQHLIAIALLAVLALAAYAVHRAFDLASRVVSVERRDRQ